MFDTPTKFTPLAPAESQIVLGNQRITILTSGLVRFEQSHDGSFEDRASTFAINRALPTPKYDVIKKDGGAMEIVTDRIYIQWSGKAFGPSSLLVSLRDKGGRNMGWTHVWRWGDESNYKFNNLGGTFRTLDRIDGRCELDSGVLSEYGLSVLDDSKSMLFTEDGWVAPRDKTKADVYLFAYGVDYREALKAFFTISGPPPLIPRWSLGNWWSRYCESSGDRADEDSYSDKEFLGLMDRFKNDDIPLSVAVLDIGWHPIEVPPEYGTGWTGYTWDKKLFPDHVSFLAELHKRDLKTTLNVHPADGVRSYEKPYAEMCAVLNRDASKKVPIPFECANKEFFKAYFEKLHHPLEDEGVDFWWIDWQQGPHSEVETVDPLWMLNHYHYLDSGRKGQRRFTFSRYAGPGSHRYPVGFSGDTVISWASLAFQPEFTATASNIGYGHWSHDIGGHYHGVKDDELMARWVQSGCFSPFLRLHSSISPFNTREPWAFTKECHDVCRRYLQFRHRLIPYLYSAAVDASRNMNSLVEPMYYDHPDTPEAYAYKSQYTFGTELLVIPVVEPRGKATALGRATGWLPEGKWVDIFDGTVYTGDRVLTFYRSLDAYPVFAKQGAIIPLDGRASLENGCPLPESIEIWLVVGADGSFDLVEDDGSGADISDVKLATTPIRYSHADGTLTIGPSENALLASRTYSVRLLGCDSECTLKVDGSVVPCEVEQGIVQLGNHASTATIGLTLSNRHLEKQDHRQRIFERLSAAQMEIDMKDLVWGALQADGMKALSKVRSTGADAEVLAMVEELLLADLGV